MTEPLLVDADGPVRTFTLNRPDAANSLSPDLLAALYDALLEAEADTSVGAIVLTGAGRGFCAGGDTSAMAGGSDPTDKLRSMTRTGRLVELLVTLQVPIVAAVHGYAAGAGVSLALACDLVVIESDTTLRLAFRNVGLVPDMGLHDFLAERVGPWRAKELIWSGATFSADDAKEWGLVNRVVEPGEALATAGAVATELAAGPRHAIRYTKQVLAQAQLERLRGVLAAEATASSMLRATADHREGVTAFRERRPPVFGQDAG
jgi:2-(1,2-epoxy-1,2-dihydrophenyl)acetyl-CoA isomerase